MAAASALLDDAAQVVAMERAIDSAAAQPKPFGMLLDDTRTIERAERIGLLPSSFNPLTRAHVALGQAAITAARLDALIWLSSVVTVDKERVERATLPDRLAQMVAHARSSGSAVAVVNRGLYVDQALAARTMTPKEARLSFIVGFDKIEQIFDPKYYDDRDGALMELFALADVLVAPRGASDERGLYALLDQPENRRFAPWVRYCPLDEAFRRDSSTEARALIEAGRLAEAGQSIAPEGLALAGLGPYSAPRAAGPDDLGDGYSARAALLAALRDAPLAEVATLPPLHALVQASADPDPRGVRLRAWVRSGGRDGITSLKEALGGV